MNKESLSYMEIKHERYLERQAFIDKENKFMDNYALLESKLNILQTALSFACEELAKESGVEATKELINGLAEQFISKAREY